MIKFNTQMLIQMTLLCSTMLTSSAYAAEAAAENAPDNSEIIVTAQRRSENLKDVPMAIAALSSEQLAKAGISSTGDLAKATPAVVIASYGAFMQPSIRGISSAGANIGDNSNVALYIDGVYQPQQIATLISLPDVQQLEILKGPQGALYGQNATGGAILVTSLSPSSTLAGKFSASYGNFNDVDIKGYISSPLTDTLSASVSGGYQKRDGFRKHVITGQRDLGLDSKVLRAKLKFQPSADASLTLTGFISDYRDSAAYSGFAFNNNTAGKAILRTLTPAQNPGGVTTLPVATNGTQFSTDPGVYSQTKSKGVSLAGVFDVGAGTVNTLTSYSKNETFYVADVDWSPVSYAQASLVPGLPLFGSFFTQDVSFASNNIGPVSFVVGGFFLTGNEEFKSNTFQFANVPSIAPAAQSAFTPALNRYGRVEKQIFAVYADFTLAATEQLTFTAGGRYTTERQRAFAGVPGGTISEYPGGAITFNKFTPRVTARYAITPDVNVYASWGKGFKSGVINTSNFAQKPVNPENITSYEAGLKGRVDAFSFDLSGYHYDYKDLQIVAYAPPVYINQNAASARINGLEASARFDVTSGLSLSASMGYVDAKFTSFPAAAVFVANGFGNGQATKDLGGTRMPRAPKFTGNVAVDYKADTSAGIFGMHAGVYHNSGSKFDVTGLLGQEKYTTVDAELSFEPEALNGLRLVVWGRNIGNETYLASFLNSQLADGVTFAPPRTFGFRAEYSF